MRGRPTIIAVSALSVFSPRAAEAALPMTFYASDGQWNDTVLPLTWGLTCLALAVIATIAILVVAGVMSRIRFRPIQDVPLTDSRATGWIAIGVGVSTMVLLGFIAWNSVVMANIALPPAKPAFTIEVIGHQWWWEFIYHGDDPQERFATANEIHIPVGAPVRFEIKTADVIHSFWVPRLIGKTDTIPGQTNMSWIEARNPGVYRGQCTEYCGQQHAHMALAVYADPPAAFQAWWKGQLQPAAAPGAKEARLGEDLFVQRCGACHAVRGTLAGGSLGPDLTHLMSRSTLAAGTLPNNVGYLSGWIANPQDLKPGALMPRPALSGPDLAVIRSFLLSLK